MKKLLITGLSLMMVLTVAACGSSDDSGDTKDEKRIVKFDSFSGGQGEEVFTELAEAFEKENPDIDIQLRFEKELDSVLNKENAKGQYSDIVYYNLGQPSAYTETQLNTGEVMDISDVFDNIEGRIDPQFASNSITEYFGDGKKYLAPIMYTPAGFYYNTELIGEGKKYELPETWDDMWALGEQAKADGISLFTYPVKGYFDTTISGMLDQVGGQEYFTEALKYGEGTWDSDTGKQVLDTIAKLVSKDNGYLFADTVANANAKDGFKINQQAVIDGDALFMPNGSWIVGEMESTTPEDFHWGLMALPAFEEGGERVATSFTEQAWIPKQAENADDAKKFLEFIYSEEGAEIMLKYDCVVPVEGITEKLEGYNKEFYSIYDDENVKASMGAFAPYDAAAIPDVDFKASLFGPIDEIATGTSTAEAWQTSLVDLWKTLREHPVE
ncbi:carbohydrate ABC transporter substrate-binding protein [Breznakia pachnodae]|uniref:N-acetylglucosamine transport system substrate-binding protein n=1 Tax=Breznakia pachnodae TaxID=265178 RepID=A0ABU0E0U2_9FIRM|nr:carbohydrate ABC transporter substrate-binding protein [Breznakia pachnodae]MDQ0360321.1 N-acetylglucosamine transport system substrate-binding protein [Breznakia pachnodae]